MLLQLFSIFGKFLAYDVEVFLYLTTFQYKQDLPHITLHGLRP